MKVMNIIKNRRVCSPLLGVCLSAIFIAGASSVATGQPLQVPPTQPGSTGGPPITPEEQARYDEAEVLYKAGERAFDNGSYALAESDARQAIALRPLVYRDLLAQALYAQGKFEEALPLYEKMAKGGLPIYELCYAMMLLKNGQWEKAVEAYHGGVRLLPFGDLMRTNTPHFSVDVPEPIALETEIHIAMGINYNGTANLSGEKDQHTKALAEYEQALVLKRSDPLANYYYAYGLQKLGQTAKAQAAFQKALNISTGEIKKKSEEGLAQVNEKLESEKAAEQATITKGK